MKKVLVVEDRDSDFSPMERVFKFHDKNSEIEILHAKTLKEGENLFFANPDVEVIIMDACVEGDEPDSMPLIEKIVKSGFKKPIIAASGSSLNNDELITAGATHKADKYKAVKLALQFLGF
ncbi:MAG: hypothetical protein PHT40_01230 [Patescibacteria group bacterium]|nr:hypothetical protein [Patescibacteria group bacterium]